MRRVILSFIFLAFAIMVGACGTEKSSETVIKFRAEDVYHHEDQLILKGYLLNIGDIEVTPSKLKLKVHVKSAQSNNNFNWNFEGIDLTSNEKGIEIGRMSPGDKRDLYIQLPDNNGIPVRDIEVEEWNATGQVEF